MLCHVTPEHTVQVECMADVRLVNCVFLLQLSHPFVPILKLLFFPPAQQPQIHFSLEKRTAISCLTMEHKLPWNQRRKNALLGLNLKTPAVQSQVCNSEPTAKEGKCQDQTLKHTRFCSGQTRGTFIIYIHKEILKQKSSTDDTLLQVNRFPWTSSSVRRLAGFKPFFMLQPGRGWPEEPGDTDRLNQECWWPVACLGKQKLHSYPPDDYWAFHSNAIRSEAWDGAECIKAESLLSY